MLVQVTENLPGNKLEGCDAVEFEWSPDRFPSEITE